MSEQGLTWRSKARGHQGRGHLGGTGFAGTSGGLMVGHQVSPKERGIVGQASEGHLGVRSTEGLESPETREQVHPQFTGLGSGAAPLLPSTPQPSHPFQHQAVCFMSILFASLTPPLFATLGGGTWCDLSTP